MAFFCATPECEAFAHVYDDPADVEAAAGRADVEFQLDPFTDGPFENETPFCSLCQEPLMSTDDGRARYPDPVCRGCAGNGVGIHVPTRTVQMIDALGPAWLFRRGKTRELKRVVRIAVCHYDQEREQGVFIGPLIAACEVFDRLVAEGWEHREGVKPERDWACEWCHGTGGHTLSIQTMMSVLARSNDRR